MLGWLGIGLTLMTGSAVALGVRWLVTRDRGSQSGRWRDVPDRIPPPSEGDEATLDEVVGMPSVSTHLLSTIDPNQLSFRVGENARLQNSRFPIDALDGVDRNVLLCELDGDLRDGHWVMRAGEVDVTLSFFDEERARQRRPMVPSARPVPVEACPSHGLRVQLEVALPGWLPPLEALMSASVEADLQALGWSEEGGEEHVQVELVPSLERKATLLRIERRKWSNDPATLHGFLGRIADLATHLNEAAWQTRLKEVGLELAVVGQPQLDGFVYGIEVGVRQGASRRARSVSEAYNLVFARVIGPKGLHIVHADDGPRGEGLAVGHPFAESLLSIQGEDEEGIQALFQEERFVDALLPIVHQHRGSVVTDHEIRCRVPVTSSQDLVEIVEAVVQLATLIRPHGLKGIGLEPAGESEAKARPGREMEREPKG